MKNADLLKLVDNFYKFAKEEENISPTEDLMSEHGVLNRMLLIYDEALSRLKVGKECPKEALKETAKLIRTFIEDHHEKSLEEGFVFPKLKKHGQHVELIDILIKQHNVGRKVTDRILKEKDNNFIEPLQQFLHMYRAHESREDTIIFPAFRKLLNEKDLENLGEKFEELELKFFKGGFDEIVGIVESLEKEFDIQNLDLFTPQIK